MYFVFEGIDGTGKSTQISLVKEKLKMYFKRPDRQDVEIITIAEPELTEVVDERDDVELTLRFALQREILFNSLTQKYNTQNIFDDFNPTIVLSDRSYYSSLAYQSNYIHTEDIRNINRFVPEPTLIFFFDNGKADDFHLEAVRQKYYKTLPLSSIMVDTKNHSVDETTEHIVNNIMKVWTDYHESLITPRGEVK